MTKSDYHRTKLGHRTKGYSTKNNAGPWLHLVAMLKVGACGDGASDFCTKTRTIKQPTNN